MCVGLLKANNAGQIFKKPTITAQEQFEQDPSTTVPAWPQHRAPQMLGQNMLEPSILYIRLHG